MSSTSPVATPTEDLDPLEMLLARFEANSAQRERQFRSDVEAIRRLVADLRGDKSPWLDRHQAAAYLSVSLRTLDSLLATPDALPNTRTLGRRVLIHRGDLDAVGARR